MRGTRPAAPPEIPFRRGWAPRRRPARRARSARVSRSSNMAGRRCLPAPAIDDSAPASPPAGGQAHVRGRRHRTDAVSSCRRGRQHSSTSVTPVQKCVRDDTLGRRRDTGQGVATDGSPDVERAPREPRKEPVLGGMSSQDERRVHGAPLADAIDATDRAVRCAQVSRAARRSRPTEPGPGGSVPGWPHPSPAAPTRRHAESDRSRWPVRPATGRRGARQPVVRVSAFVRSRP